MIAYCTCIYAHAFYILYMLPVLCVLYVLVVIIAYVLPVFSRPVYMHGPLARVRGVAHLSLPYLPTVTMSRSSDSLQWVQPPAEPPLEGPPTVVYCPVCDGWYRSLTFRAHLHSRKHRRCRSAPFSSTGLQQSDSRGLPQVRVVPLQGPSGQALEFVVHDLGGTDLGFVEADPAAPWCQIAATWLEVAGTNLFPPHGTQPFTRADEIQDSSLTAVRAEADP